MRGEHMGGNKQAAQFLCFPLKIQTGFINALGTEMDIFKPFLQATQKTSSFRQETA